jgi:hypothetical protein
MYYCDGGAGIWYSLVGLYIYVLLLEIKVYISTIYLIYYKPGAFRILELVLNNPQ